MTIHEFGRENKELMLLLHPLGAQWDVFDFVTPYLSKEFHVVIPAMPGMDPDQPDTVYTSVEEIARELEDWLQRREYHTVNCLFGCSMGGAVAVRMLANAKITSKHAVIDGGMTPYRLPGLITRVIGVRDWCLLELGKHASVKMLSGFFPEEKYGREGLAYLKKCLAGMRAKTIWRAFYSCNNYSMPAVVEQPSCNLQYWYGSGEKKARKWDIAFMKRTFPSCKLAEIAGVGHAEYFTLHPQAFAERLLSVCAEA